MESSATRSFPSRLHQLLLQQCIKQRVDQKISAKFIGFAIIVSCEN